METLDLSATVTRDQYVNAVTEFVAGLDRLGDSYDWCSSRHAYFHGIVPEYDRHAPSLVDFSGTPDNTDYAANLRAMRAKALYWVNRESATLSEANAIFTASGLPAYAPNPAEGTRIRFSAEFEATAFVTGDFPEEWIRDHLAEILTTNMNDAKMDEYRIVTGTAEVGITYGPYVSVQPVTVDPGDILTPDYT